MKDAHPYVLLFDGVCTFCSGTVSFLIARDPHEHFRFASLQSEQGRALLQRFELPEDAIDTAVLIHSGRVYTKSDAALQIARQLPRPWRWLSVLRMVPRPIRDFAYDRFARNRYHLFGKREECPVPTEQIRQRFL